MHSYVGVSWGNFVLEVLLGDGTYPCNRTSMRLFKRMSTEAECADLLDICGDQVSPELMENGFQRCTNK